MLHFMKESSLKTKDIEWNWNHLGVSNYNDIVDKHMSNHIDIMTGHPHSPCMRDCQTILAIYQTYQSRMLNPLLTDFTLGIF